LRVIASSIRKGNIIEQDGKLYVVVSAENIHPGKGTPVSQIEMRRISDGIKISERYKTTDQVERATVEERNFNYLYEDGDGFHFMNPETYDQVQVPKDVEFDVNIDGRHLGVRDRETLSLVGPTYDATVENLIMAPHQEAGVALSPSGKAITYVPSNKTVSPAISAQARLVSAAGSPDQVVKSARLAGPYPPR